MAVPVAAVVAVDPDALEDFVLATTAPEYVAARHAANADLAAGRTRPAASVFDQIRRKG